MKYYEITEAFKLKILSGPKALETSYTQCKHTSVSGGNVADPGAEFQKMLGHIEYETVVGTCGHCDLFDGKTTYGSLPPQSGGGVMRG